VKKSEAAELVASLMAAYPSVQTNNATSRVYESMLADLDCRAANAAVAALIQTRQFMPTVAEIRATVLELSNGGVAPGGEQWGRVLDYVRRYGAYRTPGVDFQIEDATTARCVKALGWQELCLSENQQADRARFIELYDKLAAHAQRELQSPVLNAAKQARVLRDAEPSPVVLQLADELGGKP
jgi:hypothetical protein